MLSKDQMEVVRESPMFRDIPQQLLDKLMPQAGIDKLSRGETLFVQGDPAEAIFIVLEGLVKLVRITPSGDEIVVAVYSQGESFGEAAALQGGVYPVTVETVEDSLLFHITAHSIAEHFRENPELAMAMLASTFRHNHELVMEIEDIKGYTGAQRLATFLVALAPVESGACTFLLPYDKGLIAGRLGMKPESLSRSFANLRREGVTIRGGHVSVADLEQLKEFSDSERQSNLRAAPCA